MSYSIGGQTLPQINDNSISALDAVSKAYDSMNSGMEKLANLPFIGRKMVQDNADARYSAALNKFSNDPEGLAEALNNGDIDTTDVTANTLNQTQERLNAIGSNYTRNYLQNRAENFNNYLDTQGGKDLLTATSLAQQGKDISALRNNANAPAEAIELWQRLNPQSQKNEEDKLALERANIAYAQNKDALALKAREAFFNLRRNLAPYLQDPDSIAAVKADILGKGVIDSLGRNISVAGDLSDILKDPTVSKQFDDFMNYFSSETLNSNVAPKVETKQTNLATKNF